jgi:hypothetical protein
MNSIVGPADLRNMHRSLWVNLVMAMLVAVFFLALTNFVIKRLPGTTIAKRCWD